MKIAMLLSGGVDSSVALALLKKQGHDVTAFYLKIWLEEELAFLGDCPWQEDMEFCRQTCGKLEVPLEIVPLQSEYFETVVSYTISELKAGYTPSPDLFCNQRIKFGAFFKKIDDSYQKVASGHYANLESVNGSVALKISPDLVKDQTYFLSHLSQQQLSRVLFPIGILTKAQVRELANEHKLPTRHRKDSQGICFLGKIKYDEFARFHLGDQPGDILELNTDKKLGEHRGYWYYTIGQRRGLRLGGGPWFVTAKDTINNVVYVTHADNFNTQTQNCFTVASFNWITVPTTKNLKIKIRHGPKFYNGQLMITDEELANVAKLKQAQVVLNEKDPGIAPGQFAVFYHHDICLGCARIQGLAG